RASPTGAPANTVTTTTTKSPGSNGFAAIGGIAVNGISPGAATINAASADVGGDIFVNGRLAALTIRNVTDGTIESPLASTNNTTITGREFTNVDIDLGMVLSAWTLKSFDGGTIEADRFGTLKTTGIAATGNAGNFLGTLISHGTGAAGLTTLSVAGDLNAQLDIRGTIGSVTARTTTDTSIGLDSGANAVNGGLLGNVTTLNLGVVSSTSVHA